MTASSVLDPLNAGLSLLSSLEQVKSKLLNNPDPAGAKLAIVLSELGKSYEALDGALLSLVTLSFDDDEDKEATRRFLLDMQSGRLRIEVEQAKGHCYIISNIYRRYLSKWFSRVLNPQEADQLQQVFRQLDVFDGIFVKSLERLFGGREYGESWTKLLANF